MPKSIIATKVFNTLYTGMKSVATGRGMTYNVKTFNDGSAVVNLIITGANVSVESSVIVTPIYENDVVVRWRVADEDRMQEITQLSEALGFIRFLIASVRIILNKI